MLAILLCAAAAIAAPYPGLTITDPTVHLLTFTGDAAGNVLGFNYGLVCAPKSQIYQLISHTAAYRFREDCCVRL